MNDLTQARKLIKECLDTQNPYLELGYCGITNLEELPELFECTHLETLILSNRWLDGLKWEDAHNNGEHNKIPSIPKEISNLKKLTKLIIGGYMNNWAISDISFLEKLTGLQSLSLSNNLISDISFLEKLTKLQYLDLTGNQISDISILEELTNLQSLVLCNNQISDIRFLKNLTGLQYLDLSDNPICNIDFLENLKRLQFINLRNNQVKEIPLSIFQFEMEINMEEYGGGLCLLGNPIESPPLEIIKQGKQAVFNWFVAQKENLNEIKIILIGEPKAGKTSLLKRLKENAFDPDEVQTDGVNIEDIKFGECKTFKKQKSIHNITGHFWDFGGQEIMNATHQFFLTKRSIYVLVLDARKDKNNATQIRDWVKRVRATGGDSPIIVLANLIDVNSGFGFVNERELQEEFPQIKCFIKVSCKDNLNIDLFKDKLAELIPTAELFKTEIDERWITIKNKLQEETKEKYYLSEQRFIEICNETHLTEEQKRQHAITFLHDLGLVLHFDDLNLSEYYVLDPYWITYGAYQILTSKHAGDEKGIVSMDKLEFIVNKEEDKKEIYQPANYKKIEYSTNERRFLIDILHEFKLCFRVPNDSLFIIPDLLDTVEPLDITNPIRLSEKNIQFVYEYDYLPSSVMPNIMVETHQMIEHKWRTGCVLQNSDCKTLVTNYLNRITIIVTGEHKKKREFMAIIRFIIDAVSQKLSNKPVRLIPLPGVNNGFADYERLLMREKNGKSDYIFDEDKPTEKRFLISELLEGILSDDEIQKLHSKLDYMISKLDTVEEKIFAILDKEATKLDRNAVGEKINEIILLQPNVLGVGINVNALVSKYLKRGEITKIRRNS